MSAPMTKEEIKQWINSEEYKELNFKREGLVVNPTKACQPLGAIFAASGFEGTLPFVHGSQGCVAYFRNNLSRHYREPFSAVSTSMTEDAAVFGGMNNMLEGLRNSYNVYKPKMIAVSTSCMAEVIGDDLNSYAKRAKELGEVPEDMPLPYAHTPSFVGTHVTGYDNMLKAILAELTQGVKSNPKKNGKINIIGGFDPHVANLREIKRVLEIMGVEYTILSDVSEVLDSPQTGEYDMYPGGTKLEDVKEAPHANGTIALQKASTLQTIKWIQENWEGQDGQLLYPPMGIRAMDKFLMEVSRLTGKEIPAELEKERGRAVDTMTDAHQYIHGKRFAIFGDPDEVFGMVSFILEMGGEPVHIVTANGSKQFRKEMATLLESFPNGSSAELYVGKDLWHLRSLLMTDPVDMLLGDSHGKWIARDAGIPLVRFGYPIFDRVNLHRFPIIGYTGVINLVSWIVNTFLDELDRNSDDSHFELLR